MAEMQDQINALTAELAQAKGDIVRLESRLSEIERQMKGRIEKLEKWCGVDFDFNVEEAFVNVMDRAFMEPGEHKPFRDAIRRAMGAPGTRY